MRVGYLEDDLAQAEQVIGWLEEAGHNCVHFTQGRQCMARLKQDSFDLLVLDWEIPDMSGLSIVETLRNDGIRTPVLFATQHDDEPSIVGALTMGADDYMVKPLKQGEFVARISALGRRAGIPEMVKESRFQLGPWDVDREHRQILLDGEMVKLTDKDFDLASYFFMNVGHIMSRTHLLEKVWGIMTPIDSRTVDVHVSRIRRSLEIRPERGFRIKTIYQHGYRLEAMDTLDV